MSTPALPGLGIAMACWLGWCLALMPVTVYYRRGILFGVKLLFGSAFHSRRRRTTLILLGMFVLGAVTIMLVWQRGGQHWQALLTSLVGLAAAGGLVWSIRIVAGSVLGVEAMGFGDVTLMFMIGAFFGWQASLICFFLAPFTSVGIAGAQWLITGERQIAFGPFLCAGAAIVILGWADIWQAWGKLFQGQMAVLMAATVGVSVVLMGVLLALLQLAKRLLGFR
jgi:prepilin signal peptidase PulO-like enzyme (type II secretory pathway)